MTTTTRTCLLLFAGTVLSACASVPADRGFSAVTETLEGRSTQQVHWRSGGAEDATVDQAVNELLAGELSREAAVQIALLNNRHLQATYESLGLAQADLVQAGLLSNPVFDAIAFFPEGGGQVSWDLGLTQSFLSILYRPLRKAIAQAHFEAARQRVAAAVIALSAQTRDAWIEAVASRQLEELLEQVVANARASFDYGQALFDAGNISQLELYRQQALVEDARLMLAEIRAERHSRAEALLRQLGLWGPRAALQLPGRLPALPAEPWQPQDLETQAVANSLELAAQRAELTALARRSGLTDSRRWLEELTVGVAAESEGGEWESGPSLEFPLPLFDQGQARVEGAAAALRQAAHNYYATAVDTRSRARETLVMIASLRDRSQHLDDVVVPLRTRIVGEELLQYNAMQVGVFDLLTEQRRQIEAAVASVRARRDYWLLRGQAQQIMAGGMAGSPMMMMGGGEMGFAGAEEGGH